MKKFIVVCIVALGLAGCGDAVKDFDNGATVRVGVVRDGFDPCEINFYVYSVEGKSRSYRARLITKECQK